MFVDFFRKAPEIYNTLRNLYLGSMLTSYLNYEPKDVKMDVEILLDTNFIVSLLDLNTRNQQSAVTHLLMRVKSLDTNSRFYTIQLKSFKDY